MRRLQKHLPLFGAGGLVFGLPVLLLLLSLEPKRENRNLRDAEDAGPAPVVRMAVSSQVPLPRQATVQAASPARTLRDWIDRGPPEWRQSVDDPSALSLPDTLLEHEALEDLQAADLSETDVVDTAITTLRESFPHRMGGKDRREFTTLLESIESVAYRQTLLRASVLGIATEGVRADGTPFRLIGFDGGKPVYVHPVNADAAISSAASFVRQNRNFDPLLGPDIDGAGFFINVNDYGIVRQHDEFQLPGGGSRLMEREAPDDHSHPDHVAGTIGAHGYNPAIKGMAPAVNLYSLNQQSSSDVYLLAMEYPFQMRRSIAGSTSLGHSDSPFGQYSYSSFDDALYDSPYYLHFYAAANNGSYGWDSISRSYNGQKNVLTVGSGRDLPRNPDGSPDGSGSVSGFSSRGPMDDGRIKPDIIANGEGLTSTLGTSGTSRKSGTSMATPNASGSAILLQDYFSMRFPGHLMRANTLKNLIIHTAEDLGEPGPDYKYGWGYMNTLRAAGLIEAYADNPGSRRLVEARLANGESHTYTFSSDGTEPLKVNLTWEDPSGPTQYTDDDRTPRLVNDLDLRVEDPPGTVHLPWAMPFVLNGFADLADAALPAVRHDNTVDTVEQVIVETPAAGTYMITVSHKGFLGDDVRYSLVISGIDTTATSPAPAISSFTPSEGFHHDTLVSLSGTDFLLGADVVLRAPGLPDIHGRAEMVTPREIRVRLPLDLVESGTYTVHVENPDGQSATAPSPFTVTSYTTLFSEDFEDGFSFAGDGWLTGADTGTDDWTLATDAAASGATSVFVPTVPSETDSWLVSPDITVPATTHPVVMTFQHKWDFEIVLPEDVFGAAQGADAAILEVSADGGPWEDVGKISGAEIVAGDYWDNVDADNPLDPPIGVTYAWTDASGGFIRTTVLLDSSAYGDGTLRFRWRLGTDNQGADTGWWIDDVVVRVASANTPPQFTSTPGTTAAENTLYSGSVSAADPDAGAVLSLNAPTLPAWLAFTDDGGGQGTLGGTPLAGDIGTHPVVLEASDGTATRQLAFNIVVAPSAGNTAPVFTTTFLDPAFATSPYSATIEASDADGHALWLSAENLPSWATLADNLDGTAVLSGTPGEFAAGIVPITFSASDGLETASIVLDLEVSVLAELSLTAGSVAVNEGDGSASVMVSRSGSTLGEVTVDYATADGTAVAGSDFSGQSGVLTWPDGDGSDKEILIPLTDDPDVEATESFTVNISNPQNSAELGALVSTTVTITDNEVNPLGLITITAPFDNQEFVRGSPVTMAADAFDPQGVKHVEFYVNGNKRSEDSSPPYEYTLDRMWDPSLTFAARLVDKADAEQASAPVTVTSAPGPLPTGWTAEDIGAVGLPGASSLDATSGTWYLLGSGEDIYNSPDEFHFAHQAFIDDGEIIARITDYVEAGDYAKAGIMIRESNAPDSTYAMVNLSFTDRRIAFGRRTATGDQSSYSNDGYNYEPLPVWLKLTRTGDLFTGYYSEDGANWTAFGSATIAMPPQVIAGLALTAQRDFDYAFATFTDVSVFSSGTLGPAGNWRLEFFGTHENTGDAADAVDFDKDGLINYMERAFGTDPTDPGSSFHPYAATIEESGSDYLTLTYRQLMDGTGGFGVDYTASGMTYTVEYDSDLEDPWDNGNIAVISVQDDTPFHGMQTVTVRLTTPMGPGVTQFIRLSVTED